MDPVIFVASWSKLISNFLTDIYFVLQIKAVS